MTDLIIIGGGAAGLAAAVEAKRINTDLFVTVIEKNDRVAKKIAVTGNGRCNISNRNITPDNYHGENRGFSDYALKRFDLSDTERFFISLGVPFTEGENGKLYPYSLQASSVGDALRRGAEALGTEIITGEEITKIEKTDYGFSLCSEEKTYSARAVIIAAGGMAGGKLGTDTGYRLLRSLSHTVSDLTPNIVQIKCESPYLRALKGNKVQASVTLKYQKSEYKDKGEVLFCDYGLSGPPIMQLSRYAKTGAVISIDLLPEIPQNELEKMLTQRTENLSGKSENYFCGLLRTRIGQAVLKSAEVDFNSDIKLLKGREKQLAGIIKAFPFSVTGKLGFRDAQVTGGGAKTDLFSDKTLMSKIHKGLFAAGEILDVDGDCGGYNLQWAWSSGRLAAKSAAEYLRGIK